MSKQYLKRNFQVSEVLRQGPVVDQDVIEEDNDKASEVRPE